MVAEKAEVGTYVVEVEGDSTRQKEQAMYSALGQVILSMALPIAGVTYVLAVPDSEEWAFQMRKVPQRVKALLTLQLWLVSETGVRTV